MRLALLLCLVATPVWAQVYPIEAEPISEPPEQLWEADVPVPSLDLPSYTVRVGFVYSNDFIGDTATLNQFTEWLRGDFQSALARSRSDGPEIVIEARWTRIAYTASTSDTANFNWLSAASHPSAPTTGSPPHWGILNPWLNDNGIDQVQMVTQNGGPSAGLGTLNSSAGGTAVSWTTRQYALAGSNYSSAHELLHNWGCTHRRADGATNAYHPEGYGWTDGGSHRSIMAYCCGTRRQVSNPAVMFVGTTTPSGTPTDNNMAVVKRRVAYVSAFRQSVPAPRAAGFPSVTEDE